MVIQSLLNFCPEALKRLRLSDDYAIELILHTFINFGVQNFISTNFLSHCYGRLGVYICSIAKTKDALHGFAYDSAHDSAYNSAYNSA
jgi:hypothetical protein